MMAKLLNTTQAEVQVKVRFGVRVKHVVVIVKVRGSRLHHVSASPQKYSTIVCLCVWRYAQQHSLHYHLGNTLAPAQP